MTQAFAVAPEIERVANLVVADIRVRGLLPGDRYLTADQVRARFQMRKAVVNDAMRHLASRQILVRKQKAGTFVGPQFSQVTAADEPGVLPLKLFTRVHVLKAMDRVYDHSMLAAAFMPGLSKILPDVVVQVHHIPVGQFAGYTKQLLREIEQRHNRREGLLLILSTRESQLAVQASGLPAVLMGSPYPGIDRLPSLDAEHFEAGRQAAAYSLGLGCRRFALLMPHKWRRGDNLVLNGLTQTLGTHGINVSALQTLSVQGDIDAIAAEIQALLHQQARPDMIICRHGFIADVAMAELQKHPVDAPKPRVMALYSNDAGVRPYARLVPSIGFDEQLGIAGKLLVAMAMNDVPEPKSKTYATRLLKPEEIYQGH